MKNFPETNISYSLLSTPTYVYQRIKDFSFLENFVFLLNAWSLKLKKSVILQGQFWDQLLRKVTSWKEKQQQQQKTNLVKTILVQQYKYNSHAKYFTNQNQSI